MAASTGLLGEWRDYDKTHKGFHPDAVIAIMMCIIASLISQMKRNVKNATILIIGEPISLITTILDLNWMGNIRKLHALNVTSLWLLIKLNMFNINLRIYHAKPVINNYAAGIASIWQ